MVKNPENVASFLEALSPKLQTLWQKEREVILKYKEEDFKSMGREFNGKINKEDFWYYITAIQEKEFSVDQEQLKEYFPIDVVTKGLMDIYQRLLGLTFSKAEAQKPKTFRLAAFHAQKLSRRSARNRFHDKPKNRAFASHDIAKECAINVLDPVENIS